MLKRWYERAVDRGAARARAGQSIFADRPRVGRRPWSSAVATIIGGAIMAGAFVAYLEGRAAAADVERMAVLGLLFIVIGSVRWRLSVAEDVAVRLAQSASTNSEDAAVAKHGPGPQKRMRRRQRVRATTA